MMFLNEVLSLRAQEYLTFPGIASGVDLPQ